MLTKTTAFDYAKDRIRANHVAGEGATDIYMWGEHSLQVSAIN